MRNVFISLGKTKVNPVGGFGEIPESEVEKFMNSGQNIQGMIGIIRSPWDIVECAYLFGGHTGMLVHSGSCFSERGFVTFGNI